MRRRREFQQYRFAARERLIDRVLIHALVGLTIGRDAGNVTADIGQSLGMHARRGLAELQRQRRIERLLGVNIAAAEHHHAQGRHC